MIAPSSSGVEGGAAATAGLSAARLAAVQALYQIELSGGSVDGALEQFLRYRLDDHVGAESAVKPDSDLFTEIVRGVGRRRSELDDILSAALTDKWPLQRLEIVLRNILYAGIYELLARDSVPARAVITEYVDLAHAFYAGAEPGMVNGILDHVARRLRPGELGPGGAGTASGDETLPAG